MFGWFSGIKFWVIVAVIAFVILWGINNLQWREKPIISFSNPASSREYVDPSYTRRRPRYAEDSFSESTIPELDGAALSYIPPPPEQFRDCYEEELSRRQQTASDWRSKTCGFEAKNAHEEELSRRREPVPFDSAAREAEVEELLNPPRPHSIRKPNATESKGERLCKEAAERIFGETFHRSIWPDWLRNPETGKGLELDLYNEKLKIAIEYHGRQHYQYVPHFHRKGPHEFEAQKRRDAYKLDICDEHGVYVITVPYYVPDNRLEQWIRYYEPTAFALREKRKEQLA